MTDTTPPALRVDDLTVRYGERPALRSVSLRVARGEVVALAGPNGSGKSTLLRSVASRLVATEGSVRVAGETLDAMGPVERARRISWMPQEEPPGDDVSLRDYVEYGRYAHTSRWVPPSPSDRALVDWAVHEVDLDGLADRGVLELSGGERQRARLARTLAQDTPVMLLDEPTAHLDVGHQLDILERVRRFAVQRSRAVLLAVHDLNLAARYADRVIVLSHGRLRAEGSPDAVLSSELLAEVWGILAELRRDPVHGIPYLIPRLAPAESGTPRRDGRPFRVHVVAGGGSGVGLLRSIVDHGWTPSAGVLPLFDTDSEAVRELGVPAAEEVPFAPIGPEALRRMDELLEGADAVVVASFPVGPSNLANLEHLLPWARRRALLLVDPPQGAWDFTAGRASAIRAELLASGAERCADVPEAVRWLERRSTTTGAAAASARE